MDERDYHRRRADHELALAESAASEAATRAHRILAGLHSDRAEALSRIPRDETPEAEAG